MSTTVKLACPCGQVTGKLTVNAAPFCHLHCFCRDCQRFAQHLTCDRPILEPQGGTALFQTYPDALSITTGQDKITAAQLTEKGLYRWHTSCCHQPIANTLRSAHVPFMGIFVTFMQFDSDADKLAALGPVTLKVFGHAAIGTMPKDTHPSFPLSAIPRQLGFMLYGVVRQKQRPSPFFDGKVPIAKANVLG